MTAPHRLILTTPQLIAAVERLDGERLQRAMLSKWAANDLVVPSRRRPGDGPEDARAKRGMLYTLDDLARVRLVVRLRRAGLSTQKVRLVFARLDPQELAEVLKPRTKAELIVNGTRGVIHRRPGRADREIPGGQLRLSLVEVVNGNVEVAAALAA